MSVAINTGLQPKAREDVAAGLSRLLADTYAVYLKTHGYHWNVRGPNFAALHALFMEQYTEMWNAIDEVAERIRALGTAASPTSPACRTAIPSATRRACWPSW